jgi:hypothetical protein
VHSLFYKVKDEVVKQQDKVCKHRVEFGNKSMKNTWKFNDQSSEVYKVLG